jgi:hypothetical protein
VNVDGCIPLTDQHGRRSSDEKYLHLRGRLAGERVEKTVDPSSIGYFTHAAGALKTENLPNERIVSAVCPISELFSEATIESELGVVECPRHCEAERTKRGAAIDTRSASTVSSECARSFRPRSIRSAPGRFNAVGLAAGMTECTKSFWSRLARLAGDGERST